MNPENNGKTAKLHLESGYLFNGTAFGSCEPVAGEVVFNTGMVGYTEALTDPSYTGQILVLTYPLMGNYGVPCMKSFPSAFEAERITVAGLVVSSLSESPSHHDMIQTLGDWLAQQGVPGIADVDTRAVTRHLREYGTMNGGIHVDGNQASPSPLSPARQLMEVIPAEIIKYSDSSAEPTVALVDCGSKKNIVRQLRERGLNVVRIPWNHPVSEMDVHGVVISNGPGDPLEWLSTVNEIRKLLSSRSNLPVLGICLGHQILALAAGASTQKMKYGHRGQNQPCLEEGVVKPRFFLTSQNHGYQVVEKSLPKGWRVLFRNVNDNSVEGIMHDKLPYMGVQFHPEASPGPSESSSLFDQFTDAARSYSSVETI